MIKKLICILFLIFSCDVFGGETLKFVTFPQKYEEYDYNLSAGIGITILPRDVFEDSFSQLPMLNINGRIGLPFNLSLISKINTIYYSNNINLGLLWSVEFHGINFALMNEFGVWFGFMQSEGLDMTSRGWTFFPSVLVGYQIDKVYLTGKFSLLYQSQRTSAGENQIGRTYNGYTGFSVSLTAEQPLWSSQMVSLEIQLNYTKFHNPTWLSYSTFDRQLLYPEIILGLNL